VKRPKGGCGPRISSDAIVSWSRGCTRSPPLGVEACQANLYVKDRGGDRRGGVNGRRIKFFSRIGLCPKIKIVGNICARR
jgi:hypothetical protein